MPSQPIDKATCGVARGKDLVVFVGEKIDLRPFEPQLPAGVVLMDGAFRARYRVLQVVCGRLATPEIEFEVYDHYGTPEFADFQTVLLFVSRANGRFVHQKYQYFDVYRTADGSWVGCGDPYKLEPEVHRGTVRARPIAFERPVKFSLLGLSDDEIASRFPPAFFDRNQDTVTCRAGAPLVDLFTVKRDGVLKARGLFP